MSRMFSDDMIEDDDEEKNSPKSFLNSTTSKTTNVENEGNDNIIQRIYTPKCNKCGIIISIQRGLLPPKRWDCPTKGCGGKLWQPDDTSQFCDVCGILVGRFKRHHCRRCGYLICSNCLGFYTIFAEWSLKEKQRICRRCAVPQVPVVMSGWMMKLGQRSAFFGEKFHLRYFELRGTVLLYGKSKCKGEIMEQQNTSTLATTTTNYLEKGKLNDMMEKDGTTNSSFNSSDCKSNNNNNNDNNNNNTTVEGQIQSSSFCFNGHIDIIGAKIMDVAIHPYAFCIVGPRLTHGYVFSVDSFEKKQQWINAIQEQIKHSQQYYGYDDFEDDLNITEKVIYPGSGLNKNLNICIQDFELLTVIGLGSFGRVMQVRHKNTGNIYAMKIIDKNQVFHHKMVTHTNAEKLILSEINHPFIVKLYYAFQTKRHLILVLEFLCGGELFFHLQRNRKFSEKRAQFYTAEIGLAIEYIHSKNVLYRDLKPENLILDREGHVILTDFGLAKRDISAHISTYTFCGTPEYMAPELIKKSGHTNAVDWWSLGIFLYEMVYGIPPFYSTNLSEMYNLILYQSPIFPSTFSPELKSLLERLLEKDPIKRLTNGIEFKAHPFFKGIDFEKLLQRKIKPEFVPDVKQNDLRYFDKRFLQESTKIVQLDQPNDPNDPLSRVFEGFDFNLNLTGKKIAHTQMEGKEKEEKEAY